MNLKNTIASLIALLFSLVILRVDAKTIPAPVVTKYPDYAKEFIGRDKFETFNRKMFSFNRKLNKYALKPVHIVWASIMPKYGMDRIQSAYTNIEYPKRLVSTLLQRDFKASGHETLRFLTNTTLGLGGLYDPAKSIFKLEPLKEDVAQGLAKCKIKQGPYLVLPFINSTTPRALLGSLIECPLDASMYIGSPITALVKAGLIVNRTSYAQPFIKLVESNFADPYDIAKKIYGLERYIKDNNLDRKEVLQSALREYAKLIEDKKRQEPVDVVDKKELESGSNLIVDDSIKGYAWFDTIDKTDVDLADKKLVPDIILKDFNPQCPVTDAMRTALFSEDEKYKSIWSELSVWNRNFSKKVKTSDINLAQDREDYNFKYIMQKDKNSPLAILYPSIGEGITSHHSLVFAKIFYDAGYSVLILGSHFNWEFVKSMPKGYAPGMPMVDVAYLRDATNKMVKKLEDKYECKFSDKVVLGTSFGAFATLFLADMESRENTLNISKYISINPPVELLYAVNVIDKNNDTVSESLADIKNRVAISASKIIQLYEQRNDKDDFKLDSLPFSQDEAKLITCFVLRQKLSDLIFTLNEVSQSKKTDIYDTINNVSYYDYAKKYMLDGGSETVELLNQKTSLYYISNFLKNNRNYKILHALDDYLVNDRQLKDLRQFAGSNLVLFDRGSHLGYLYRKEFKDVLLNEIRLKKSTSE